VASSVGRQRAIPAFVHQAIRWLYQPGKAFKVLQRNIDVIPSSTDFSTYKVVVAPNLRLIDDATFARLQTFVTDGGGLVLNYRAGTQKMDCSMRRVLPPGIFAEMAGVTAESNLDLVENNISNSEIGISFS
jgi:beta-galactosidase GanA